MKTEKFTSNGPIKLGSFSLDMYIETEMNRLNFQTIPLRRIFFILVTALIAALVFSPWRSAEFLLWDDDVHLTANPLFHPLNGSSFFEFWTRTYESLYTPVTYSVWGAIVFLNQSLVGNDWGERNIVWPFLALNLLSHLLNGFLLYCLVRRLKASDLWALLGVALFLFHPAQVEAVAFVSGFRQILWVNFALAAVLCYISNRWIQVLIWSILSLLSMPTAAILPVVLLAFEPFREKPVDRPKARFHFWILGFLLILSVLVLALTKRLQSDLYVFGDQSFGLRFQVIIDTFGFYLKKVVMPLPLTVDYGRTPGWVQGHSPTVEMGIFCLAALIFLMLLMKRPALRNQSFLILILFVAPLVLVSGAVPFLQQNYSTVTDRYLYFSLIGIGTLIALNPKIKIQFLSWVIASLICVCVYLSFQQTKIWNSNLSLFTYALEVNPNSFMAENNLGVYLGRNGNEPLALEHFKRALKINPRSVSAGSNIGTLLAKAGRIEEALAHYQEMTAINPNKIRLHLEFGILLCKSERLEDCLKELNHVLKLDPNNIEAHVYAGIALCRLSRCKEAVGHFENAVRSDPQNQQFAEYLKMAQQKP